MLKHNKLILGILALAISISAISYNTTVSANAQAMQLSDYNAERDKGLPTQEAVDKNGITWEYKEFSDGTLYIVCAKSVQAHMEVPSQLNGKNVSVIEDIIKYPQWKDYFSEDECKDHVVQSIKIPSTVKYIETGAFHCKNLTDVQLPATTWVADGAFLEAPWFENQRNSQGLIIINGRLFNAKNLSGDIIIPSNVKEIVNSAFSSQENITSITIPNSVTEIGNDAFWGCSNLDNITIPNNVTQIGNRAFYSCSSLKKVKILNNNIHLDAGAFESCPQLTNVELPSNASVGDQAFDDGVTITKNGVSCAFKDLEKKSSTTGNNTSTTNNVAQTTIVSQGWHKDGEHWNWLWSDGSKKNGWYNEGGNWYYFYGTGQMATEFIDLGGGFSYYLKPNSVDGKAVMVTGWQYIDGDWFYFNPASDGYSGVMKRACWTYIDGNWYYFYYDGTMARNTYVDGYYVNSSGVWVN